MDQRSLEMVKIAIEQIAKREGISSGDVREQMKIAILNGLNSNNPQSKAYWQSIPCEGKVPTPEEFILFSVKVMVQER